VHAGLIKLLRAVGTEEQRARYLPALLQTDYARRLHAAQFVTEVQGGSDVGSNDCRAQPAPDRPGGSHQRREVFCSVADAGVFVVTARLPDAAEGTKGLGLFVVPRHLEGGRRPNGFSLRRLKYKLGTRSLASGEIDFDGALGEPSARSSRASRTSCRSCSTPRACTTRWPRAAPCVGRTSRRRPSRACAGPSAARSSSSLARPADARADEAPNVRCRGDDFRILAMSDAGGGEDLRAARRTHVNINKYWTAIACTAVVRDAIELLGGNGTIEEFSVLPRLYRDAIVIESWEGTHNTLCAQVLRDFAGRGLHRAWLAEVEEAIGGTTHRAEPIDAAKERARAMHADVTRRIARLLAGGEDYATAHIRHVVDRMCTLHSYASLLREADWQLGRGRRPPGQGRAARAVQAAVRRPRRSDGEPSLGRLQQTLSATL